MSILSTLQIYQKASVLLEKIGQWFILLALYGGVSEWLKEPAWKACVQETVPWVRIPPPPIFFYAISPE